MKWIQILMVFLSIEGLALVIPGSASAITNYDKIIVDDYYSGKVTWYECSGSPTGKCETVRGSTPQVGWAADHYYGPYGCTDYPCLNNSLAPFGTIVTIPSPLHMQLPNGTFNWMSDFNIQDTGASLTYAQTVALGRGFVDIFTGMAGSSYAINNHNQVEANYDYTKVYGNFFSLP